MRARLAVIALLAGAVVLATAAPAQAHSAIVDSTPAEGETLTALPEAFSVTANETLLDLGGQGVFALVIRDAEGRYYGDGCVDVVDATMSAEPAIGASGDYEMLWQIVSADGHPVSGEIAFSWEAPAGFAPATPRAAVPVCGEDPGAVPTPAPDEAGESGFPWPAIATFAAAILAVIVATRAARIQQRTRAADRLAPPDEPPAE